MQEQEPAVGKAAEEVKAEQEELAGQEIDALSSAWMFQISRPLDEVLASRQVTSEQPEGLSQQGSKQLDAPPRSSISPLEAEQTLRDSILEIEQELFAPTHELVRARPAPEAAGSGHTVRSGSQNAA